MIRRELGEAMVRAGGFVTHRNRDENGTILGFEITAADGFGGRECFLDFTGERPGMNLDVFSGLGVHCLTAAAERSFSVLDEIGGVELLDQDFMEALAACLRGDRPCIGVMKGPGPAGKLVELMGLSTRYELARRTLYDYLKHDPNTLLLETTGRDDEAARAAVREWVREYAF